MATDLAHQTCVPCQTGVSDITKNDVPHMLPEVPGWELIEETGVQKLHREFTFKNWDEAMVFANKISQIAAEQDHHPLLVVGWGKVTVLWWTHKVGGLHSNDFIMAAKTNELV